MGIGSGPLVVAAISDNVFGGNAIGLGMATTIAICCPLAALALATGCKAMHTAVVSLENATG